MHFTGAVSVLVYDATGRRCTQTRGLEIYSDTARDLSRIEIKCYQHSTHAPQLPTLSLAGFGYGCRISVYEDTAIIRDAD